MTKAALPKSTKTLSRRVLVTVHRDAMTVTPRVIWQHEFPILEAIFGEGQIKPVERGADGKHPMDEGYSKKAAPELLPFNKKQDQILPPSETASIGYVFIGDARGEYERLAQVYGKHAEVNESNVENVYGRFQSGAFKAVVGSPEVDDLPEQQLRDLARSHGYLPIVSEKSSDDEKKAAYSAQEALATMPHDELVKLATTLGVEIA